MKTRIETKKKWGALWSNKTKLDGLEQYLCTINTHVALFNTRQEARDWIEVEFEYVGNRADLRKEPFNWRMPKPVKVTITYEYEGIG
jgi:hypothetical protein